MRKILLAIAFLSSSFVSRAENPILGFWKTIDDETGEAKSIVRVYEHDGKVYGRVHRVLTDRTAKAKIAGAPLIEGLDIIKDLTPSSKGKLEGGKVLDPKNGRAYSCQIWVEDGKLIMRGSLFGIGRKQVWLPTEAPVDAPDKIVPDPKF